MTHKNKMKKIRKLKILKQIFNKMKNKNKI